MIEFNSPPIDKEKFLYELKKRKLEIKDTDFKRFEEFSEELVLKQLKNYDKQKNVQNPIGWLISACKNDYSYSPSSFDELEPKNGINNLLKEYWAKIEIRENNSNVSYTSIELPELLKRIKKNIEKNFQGDYEVEGDVYNVYPTKYVDGKPNFNIEITSTVNGKQRITISCDDKTKYLEESLEKDPGLHNMNMKKIKDYFSNKKIRIKGNLSLYVGTGKLQLNAKKIKILKDKTLFQDQIDKWKEEIDLKNLKPQRDRNNLYKPSIFKYRKKYRKVGVISTEGDGLDDFKKNIFKKKKNISKYIDIKIDIKLKQGLSLDKMCQSINEFNQDKKDNVDCICIVRGGGNKYDLLDFYNPELVKNITDSKIPVLTGIGHEKDTPYCCEYSFENKGTPSLLGEFLGEYLYNPTHVYNSTQKKPDTVNNEENIKENKTFFGKIFRKILSTFK